MIVDCAVYRDGRRQQVEAMSLTEAAAQRDPDNFVWLGTFDPSPDELAEIRDTFGLHELAVEDAREFHLRPKVEQFDDGVQLVILRTARYDDEREEIDFGEISVFLGAGFVITVRQGVASELRGARPRLERRPELLESRQRRGAVGDPGPGRRRLRPGDRRGRAGHRTAGIHGVLRRRRADRTDLLPAP